MAVLTVAQLEHERYFSQIFAPENAASRHSTTFGATRLVGASNLWVNVTVRDFRLGYA
jgi:hypothetical protein